MEKSPRAEAATVLRRFVEIVIDPQTAKGIGTEEQRETIECTLCEHSIVMNKNK